MAANSTPHFHNSGGHTQIKISAHEFQCVGAKPPFDHPHVFLDMGDDHEIVCPYCSTLYVHDTTLAAGETVPANCAFEFEDA
ncbi:zinc-finger domain-containing protein [Tepidamorphus sp. 3E244]|uniref:zinc-finger domain-containing protein n=1 Tax=Tepidamorphus sp. 3E244 TaxID=3385498 RepID=UPI0038FCD070